MTSVRLLHRASVGLNTCAPLLTAMAMARGAVGDYYITRPLADLNWLAAVLHDREPSKS
jgi:hypothetical protein